MRLIYSFCSCLFFQLLLLITPVFANNPTELTVACLRANNLPYNIPGSTNWTSLVTPYNLRLQYEPAAIVIPLTPEQISQSIRCAASNNLKVQAKSGGHSYASYSSGGINGSLIVDLREFNGVEVDKSEIPGPSFVGVDARTRLTINQTATNIAIVGSGARLGNLATQLFQQGRRAVPHGTDYFGVGVGGHMSHGGYGHASRAWGLAVDAIVGLDVVLANGLIVFASKDSYPDLFYALRGAADSFGIVTNFHLQTVLAPRLIINFIVQIPSALNNVSSVVDGFMDLQEKVFDDKIAGTNGNLSFDITTNQDGNFTISGWCIDCQLNNFNLRVLPVLIEKFPPPSSKNLTSLAWLPSLQNLGGVTSLEQPLYDYVEHDTFYVKSVKTRNSTVLSRDQVQGYYQTIIEQGRKVQGGKWWSSVYLWGGIGSKINAIDGTSSAFGQRDTLWLFQNFARTNNSLPPFPDSLTTFIDTLTDSLDPPTVYADGSPFTAYLNFVDPDLSSNETIRLYYGSDNYQKLLGIKKEFDTNYTFWNPQSVGADQGRPEVVNGLQTGSTSAAEKEGMGEKLKLIGGWLFLYGMLVAFGAGGLL